MASSVEHRPARDGTPLLVRRWTPESGRPWASLVLVHGLAEHSGRYEHVGDRLAVDGIEAHALDLRGFGGSGGRRAWVDRWSQLHDDVEGFLVAVRAGAPDLPVVLYGHSLGGLIALGYVLDGRARPDLLVLSAPAIDASIPAWQRALLGVLGRLAPRMRISNRLASDSLSKDPAVWDDYQADPLNEHRSTVWFGRAGLAEQQRVARALDRLAIPTLVIHGADDRLVPSGASAVLEGRRGVTRRVYDDVRHELHNEPEREAVIDDVVAWIRDNV